MKLVFVIIMVLNSTSLIMQAQNFKIKFDTVNFGFKGYPFLTVFNNSFDEFPLSNYLGADKTESYPIKKNGLQFEYTLTLRKPTFIRIVNAEVLAIPNQKVNANIGMDEFIDVKDSNNVNHYFSNIKREFASIRSELTKEISAQDFLKLYDSLKSTIANELQNISLAENRKRYRIDFWTISFLKQYFMAELGNFLFTPTWLKNNFDMAMYKNHKADIDITDPKVLLEFQGGTLFLQRYFFYYALPENNYDLTRTLNSDVLFKDNEVKKYLSFRYFSHLYSDKAIVAKIKNFDSEFYVFKANYTFTVEQRESLRKLEIRMDENKYGIQKFILNEDINSQGGVTLSINSKLKTFGGDKLLYIWASWCLPCREFLSTLKSSNFIYKGRSYPMIFLSIDTDIEKWEKANHPVFTTHNSFKITRPDKSKLIKNFELDKVVPRILLLQSGRMIELNVEKSQLIQ